MDNGHTEFLQGILIRRALFPCRTEEIIEYMRERKKELRGFMNYGAACGAMRRQGF
jgi:hypothetical protein